MQNTDYKIDGQSVSYKINDDGYLIYLDNKAWIKQYEPYIPYPELSYEEGCLKQIAELVEANTVDVTEEEEITPEKMRADIDYIALMSGVDLTEA